MKRFSCVRHILEAFLSDPPLLSPRTMSPLVPTCKKQMGRAGESTGNGPVTELPVACLLSGSQSAEGRLYPQHQEGTVMQKAKRSMFPDLSHLLPTLGTHCTKLFTETSPFFKSFKYFYSQERSKTQPASCSWSDGWVGPSVSLPGQFFKRQENGP